MLMFANLQIKAWNRVHCMLTCMSPRPHASIPCVLRMHAMQMTPLRLAALAVLAATLLTCSAENVKKGLVLGPDCTSVQAEPFEDTASWFYTYSQQPKPSLVDWANNHSVEFVLMIGWQFVEFVNGTRCSLGASKPDECSVSDIVQSLQEGIDQLHVRPKYLLGFNEPYNHALSGGDVADLWRRYIQPAAELAQLQLHNSRLLRKQTHSSGHMMSG